MSSLKFRHWLFLLGIDLLIVGFFVLPWAWTGSLLLTSLGAISVSVASLLVPASSDARVTEPLPQAEFESKITKIESKGEER